MFNNNIFKNDKKGIGLSEHQAEYREVRKSIEKEADRILQRELLIIQTIY